MDINCVIVDSADPDRLAAFWSELLDRPVVSSSASSRKARSSSTTRAGRTTCRRTGRRPCPHEPRRRPRNPPWAGGMVAVG
ncbi:VOC family protein [Spirillospora sp. NPDC049024]